MSTENDIDHRPPAAGTPTPLTTSEVSPPGVPSPRAVPFAETITAPGDDRPTGVGSDAWTGLPTYVAEHALLGTVLLAPQTLSQVEPFLGVRDFATHETRAVYQALRGLAQAGVLFDLTAVAPQQRRDAAHENQLRLHAALTAPGSPHATTDIADVPALLAGIAAAAPVDSMGLRGVFEPGMPARLGRMVAEESCRRQLAAAGVALRRTTPLVPPSQSHPTREQRRTQVLLDNLTRVHDQLDVLAGRLARATHHDPAAMASTATADTAPAPAPVAAPRALLEPITRVLRRRAERHLLHVALHAGNLADLPAEILALAPEHFTDPRHATTWRAIHQLRDAGQPVNYVTVLHNLHTTPATGPALSDRALVGMAAPPAVAPQRIARSLRTLAAGALRDTVARAHAALTAAAADRATPVADAVTRAAADVRGLTDVARTALRHQHAAHQSTADPAAPRGRHRAP